MNCLNRGVHPNNLCEIICQAGDEPAAALFVPMGTLENSKHPKLLANSAKHFAFTRCGESNLFGMVDAQLAVVEGALHEKSAFSLRSRRKHKAWGVSPRWLSTTNFQARECGRQNKCGENANKLAAPGLPPICMGSKFHCFQFLGLTPQALCLRLLRRLKADFSCKAPSTSTS